MDTWLQCVSNFLGCEISQLNPNTIYAVTSGVVAVFFWSMSYLFSRSGRK